MLTGSTAKEDETQFLFPLLGCGSGHVPPQLPHTTPMMASTAMQSTSDFLDDSTVQTMYYLKASLIMSLRYRIPPPCRAPALSNRAGKFTIAIFTLSLISGECQWNAATGTPDVSQLKPCNVHGQSCQSSKVSNTYSLEVNHILFFQFEFL